MLLPASSALWSGFHRDQTFRVRCPWLRWFDVVRGLVGWNLNRDVALEKILGCGKG
jgi:hypothetical protein